MRIKRIFFVFLASILIPSVAFGKGGGDFKIGYVFLDETGNLSANNPTFNTYKGLSVSLEKFRFDFPSGLKLNANLMNITLDNRNLNLGIFRSGLFGLKLSNNQYRRVYNFNGDAFTRRHRTDGSVWVYPFRHLRIYGGGSLIGLSGEIEDLFNPKGLGSISDMDYEQKSFNIGIRGVYEGRMIQAEYSAVNYNDSYSPARDQKRDQIRFDGLAPLPKFEKIVISGGFKHFETKYSESDFGISANTGWGGVRAQILPSLAAGYNFVFDRASSDSDLIATDNLAYSFDLSYARPLKAGITAGYQFDINDDFEDETQANSLYFSGWCKAIREFEFRFEYGNRLEEIREGTRLLGDEDRTRHKLEVKYRRDGQFSIAAKYEGKRRKNEQIGSKADFDRLSCDMALDHFEKWFNLVAGYSFSKGDYENRDKNFEFRDNLIHGHIAFKKIAHILPGFGGQYYRSKRDIDVESFRLTFDVSYQFATSYRFDVEYNVHNFDDFLVSDSYYTANIVEMNLIKEFSL
jgi:hypothetical protein